MRCAIVADTSQIRKRREAEELKLTSEGRLSRREAMNVGKVSRAAAVGKKRVDGCLVAWRGFSGRMDGDGLKRMCLVFHIRRLESNCLASKSRQGKARQGKEYEVEEVWKL